MKTSIYRLLTSFVIMAMVLSFKQHSVVRHTKRLNQREINELVAKGKDYLNSHIDSMVPVSEKLLHIAQISGNQRALVYGELFSSQYFWLSGDHKKSMEAAFKCLNDAEKGNIKEVYPTVYGLIGNLHKENTNYKLAFDAAEKGLYWAKSNKDTASVIFLRGLKAMFVHTLSRTVHSSAGSDSSINIYLDGLKIAESNPKFESSRILFYDNIAQYYLDDNKDYKTAIYYANKGVGLALKYNRQRSLTYSYTWLGQAYYYMGQKRKGLDYLNKALKISHSLKEPYREMEIYGHLYDYYYLAGNYRKAIALNKIAENMRDSLQVNVNEKQVSELQIKYETAKKDKEIALMDRARKVDKRQMIVVLGGSLLGITFTIILILQYRVISRNNHLIKISNEKKDKALENIAFIQAHELRRPLASIMGLINVIKAIGCEVDEECLSKLEEAGHELDTKIHAVLAVVDTAGV